MSERTEPNLNEMINSAGDGSGLQLPPAFVMVNPNSIVSIRKIMKKWMGVLKVLALSSTVSKKEK